MVLQSASVKYTGTGVGIFLRVVLGFFLSLITLGLYFPWYLNGIIRYGVVHVEFSGRPEPVVFNGSGAKMFLRFILWYLLLIVTLGFGWPWVINSFFRYIAENIEPSGGRLN